MKALEEVLTHENTSFNSDDNDRSTKLMKSKSRLSIGSDVYFMEKPMDSKMSLCCHGRVSLDSVFKGEVKAVIYFVK